MVLSPICLFVCQFWTIPGTDQGILLALCFGIIPSASVNDIQCQGLNTGWLRARKVLLVYLWPYYFCFSRRKQNVREVVPQCQKYVSIHVYVTQKSVFFSIVSQLLGQLLESPYLKVSFTRKDKDGKANFLPEQRMGASERANFQPCGIFFRTGIY